MDDDGDDYKEFTEYLAELEPIELIPAYVWDCNACGRQNFQRSVSRILDPRNDGDAEKIVDLFDQETLENTLAGEDIVRSQSAPVMVRCPHCENDFRVVVTGMVKEDEEGE